MARFESEGTWFSKAEHYKRALAVPPSVVFYGGGGGGSVASAVGYGGGGSGDYERTPAGHFVSRAIALQAYDAVADMLVDLGGIPGSGVDRHTPFPVLRYRVVERFTRTTLPPPPARRLLGDFYLGGLPGENASPGKHHRPGALCSAHQSGAGAGPRPGHHGDRASTGCEVRSKDGKMVCLSAHVHTEVTHIGTDHSVTIEVCTLTRAQDGATESCPG